MSLVLSALVSSDAELMRHGQDLRHGREPSVSPEALAQALDALEDPQLQVLLARQLIVPVPADACPAPAADGAPPAPAPQGPGRALATSALHRSPFALLGASVHDTRRRIVELAEEQSLALDHDACQAARSDLTNPRTRLGAEMAWLPGVAPDTAAQLAARLLRAPMALRAETGLPALAHLNLLAAAFEAVDGDHDRADLVAFILAAARRADEVSPEGVRRDINADRAVSGFPEVMALDQIEAELAERRRSCRNAIRSALDRLPAATLIDVMTETVQAATSGGRTHAPALVDSLVDGYEVEIQAFLHGQADTIRRLITLVGEAAACGETGVAPYVDRLEAAARTWSRIVRPIGINARVRGLDHEPSRVLALEIRSLAVDLFNLHDLLPLSRRLTAVLQELFRDTPEVMERLEQDAQALADIVIERRGAPTREAQWEREIAFLYKRGVIFQRTLSISSAGISWGRTSYPLESITRVRWGGVRHSYYSIPGMTLYTVVFGDQTSETRVMFGRKREYTPFIEKLFHAVGWRMLMQLLQALKAGRDVPFGDAILHDDGITLINHKFFRNEAVRCAWKDVRISSSEGYFHIQEKNSPKIHVSLSYLEVSNVPILEYALRTAFEQPGMSRLSDLLQ